MPIRRILLWTALALAGLLVAVAVTTAATSLTSPRVGLQAEPLDAGDALAPREQGDDRATASPTPDASPSPEGEDDDDSGRGRGRNRGRGGDDD
jgi:hypothetical protein